MATDAALGPFAETRLTLAAEDDVIAARGAARAVARLLQFGAVDQSRIATAVSELARNVIRYATDSRGEVVIRSLHGAPRGSGIEIVVSDTGPGIADLAQAMNEGFTSAHGMGMGLPGTRRLMDEMTIDSARGRGTVVTVRKWHTR